MGGLFSKVNVSKSFHNYISVPMKKAVFHYEPEQDPKIEDINKDLAKLNEITNKAFENIKKLMGDDGDIAFRFWEHILVTGNFKNELKEEDAKEFSKYIDDVIKIGEHFYIDKSNIPNFSVFSECTSNGEREKALYNKSEALFNEINLLIDNQISQRKDISEDIKNLLISRSKKLDLKKRDDMIKRISGKFNYGKILNLFKCLIEYNKKVFELEASYLKKSNYETKKYTHHINSLGEKIKNMDLNKEVKYEVKVTRSKYNYKPLWNKWRKWKGKDTMDYDTANEKILSPQLTEISNRNYDSKIITIDNHNKTILDFFSDLKAIKYKLSNLDHDIFGNIPDNNIIKNNDSFVIQRKDEEKKIVKIGTQGIKSYGDFADELTKGLNREAPGVYRIEVIYPPAPAEQYGKIGDKEIFEKTYWTHVNNIFQKLKGTGFDQSYDYKIYYLLNSDYPFQILSADDDFTIQKWLNLNEVNLDSKYNDKDSIDGVRDEVFKYGKRIPNPNYGKNENEPQFIRDPKGEQEITVKAPGPYFRLIGGFSKNEHDLNEIRNNEKKKFLNQVEGWVTSRLMSIGFKPKPEDKKDKENTSNSTGNNSETNV